MLTSSSSSSSSCSCSCIRPYSHLRSQSTVQSSRRNSRDGDFVFPPGAGPPALPWWCFPTPPTNPSHPSSIPHSWSLGRAAGACEWVLVHWWHAAPKATAGLLRQNKRLDEGTGCTTHLLFLYCSVLYSTVLTGLTRYWIDVLYCTWERTSRSIAPASHHDGTRDRSENNLSNRDTTANLQMTTNHRPPIHHRCPLPMRIYNCQLPPLPRHEGERLRWRGCVRLRSLLAVPFPPPEPYLHDPFIPTSYSTRPDPQRCFTATI